MHVDWWSVGVGFYASFHLLCTVIAVVRCQRMQQALNNLQDQVDSGFHYANTHTNNSIAALRNGSGVHGN